jgi:hypothetical protein
MLPPGSSAYVPCPLATPSREHAGLSSIPLTCPMLMLPPGSSAHVPGPSATLCECASLSFNPLTDPMLMLPPGSSTDVPSCDDAGHLGPGPLAAQSHTSPLSDLLTCPMLMLPPCSAADVSSHNLAGPSCNRTHSLSDAGPLSQDPEMHAQLMAVIRAFPWNNGITLFQGNMTPRLVEWCKSDTIQVPELHSSLVVVCKCHFCAAVLKLTALLRPRPKPLTDLHLTMCCVILVDKSSSNVSAP